MALAARLSSCGDEAAQRPIFGLRNLASAHDYDLGRRIAPSAYSEIRLLFHRENSTPRRAGKFYIFDREDALASTHKEQHYERELKILSRLAGAPNVLHLLDSFESDAGDVKCLVTEYCPGGDAFSLLERKTRLAECECAALARGVFASLSSLHSRGIVHADVKPENVLLADPADLASAVLADYGLAEVRGEGAQATRGTLEYLAPEVAARERLPDFSSDVWCAALCCFVCLVGYNPFQLPDAQQKFWFSVEALENLRGRHRDVKRILDEGLKEVDASRRAKNFFRSALRYSPNDRPTANECLGHHWLKQ